MHLDIITAREQSRVPSHISAIIHHIRGHSLSLEGIFRISASRSVMDDITDKLNLGAYSELVASVRGAASVRSMWMHFDAQYAVVVTAPAECHSQASRWTGPIRATLMLRRAR